MLARARSRFLLSFWFLFSVVAVHPVRAQINTTPPAMPRKKEIKDPAEYNDYVSAAQQGDASARISSLKAFLTQYPNSVLEENAFEVLLGAYRQVNDQANLIETAQKLLQISACNIRGLEALAYTKQAMATAGQNAEQNFTDAGQAAERGLRCLQNARKPHGMSAAEWQTMKSQATLTFNSADGLSAYAAKDYAKAERYLRAAVEADPTNPPDVYELALAYLTAGPAENDVDGLFFIARAANLQQGAAKDAIAKFGKSKYNKYHGSDEGWSDVLALTATAPTPPANFTITRYVPPSPAGQKESDEMMVLSEDVPEHADKVRGELTSKPLQTPPHTLSIDPPGETVDAHVKSIEVPTTLIPVDTSEDVPSSATSSGVVEKPVKGVRPSVTTVGPSPHFWENCCSAFGFIEPVYIAYAVPYAPQDDDGTPDVDYVHAPGQRNADGAADGDFASEGDASIPEEPKEEPVTVQAPTVLVFKDGHQSDVLNYAIVGDTLFDFAPDHTRRIPLTDLDLIATHKANDDRGVDFQIPPDAGPQ